MLLYFAGAESPAHLNTLRSEGVTAVAVNVTALSRRIKDLGEWATEDRLGGMEWVLYADSPDTDWEAALTVLDGADQFSGNLGTQVQPAQGLQTRDQRSRVQVSHHAQARHIRRCPLLRVGPVCTGFHGCCTHGPAL